MRRRYTSARNPIEALRERWGLGDTDPSQSVPSGQGPSIGVHPLPLTAREAPAPYSRPLPAMPGSPLLDPPESSDSGTVDYEARQRGQLDDVGQGGIAEPVNVYPNWASRLEGMRDFLAVGRPTITELPILATPGSATFDVYEVPQGYTAFLQRFRYFFEPIPGGLSLVNVEATLLVDGVIVPDYFNLPLGPLMADYEDTFVIAAQGRRLQLRLDFLEAVGDIDFVLTPLRMLFYGNVRARSGEPESREVGVRAPPVVPQPVVVVPPPAESPPPSAPRVVPRVLHSRGGGTR